MSNKKSLLLITLMLLFALVLSAYAPIEEAAPAAAAQTDCPAITLADRGGVPAGDMVQTGAKKVPSSFTI
jgi:hypothetical protein